MRRLPRFPPKPRGCSKPIAQGRFKVGIVWMGRPTFTGNFKRAVSLKRFLPLAEIPGVPAL